MKNNEIYVFAGKVFYEMNNSRRRLLYEAQK